MVFSCSLSSVEGQMKALWPGEIGGGGGRFQYPIDCHTIRICIILLTYQVAYDGRNQPWFSKHLVYIYTDYSPVVNLNWKPELSCRSELFNMCLKEFCFPDCWEVSSVNPVIKSVREMSKAKNSLVSCPDIFLYSWIDMGKFFWQVSQSWWRSLSSTQTHRCTYQHTKNNPGEALIWNEGSAW